MLPAYNTKKRLVQLFEPEGKNGHFNVLYTVCFMKTKKLVSFLVPMPIHLRRRRRYLGYSGRLRHGYRVVGHMFRLNMRWTYV